MTDTPTAPEAAPKQPSPQEMQDHITTQFIWPCVANTVNGIRASLPQIPIAHLLIKTCGLFGQMIGQTTSIGALADILPIRAACIEAFTKNCRSVKISPPPALGVAQKLDS